MQGSITSEANAPRLQEATVEKQSPTFLTWFTVERAAYALLILLGLVARLAQLGYRPLASAEAIDAWGALRWVEGLQPLEPSSSALLISLDIWSFDVVGAGSLLARFWPALFGAIIPLWLYLLRMRLGRAGALTSAILLTFSTHVLFFSRHASGDIMAASLTLGLLVALIRFHDDGESRWLMAGAILLGLLLTSAPSAYWGLVGLLLLSLAWGREFWLRLYQGLNDKLVRRAGIALAVTTILSATGLFRYPQGLADTASLLSRWVAGFFTGETTYPIYWLLTRLALDEPLLLVLGIAAVVAVARNPYMPFEAGLTYWVWGVLVLASVRPARQPGDLLMVILPLALLAGPLIVRFVGEVRLGDLWQEAVIFVAVVAVLVAAAAVWLTNYTSSDNSYYLQTSLVPLGIVATLVIFYGLWINWRFSLQMAGVVGLIVLVLMGFSLAWSASLDIDPARRLALVLNTASDGLRHLVDEVSEVSAMRVGDAALAPITLVGNSPDPALAWAFRRFPNLRFSLGVSAENAPLMVISPVDNQPALRDSYSGSLFSVQRTFNPFQLSRADFLRWVFYRRGHPEGEATENIILWLRHET